MIKRISLLLAAAMLVATMTMAGLAGPAFAQITKETRGGNEPGGEARGIPATNPADKCPPGQNKELSPGGQKKCER